MKYYMRWINRRKRNKKINHYTNNSIYIPDGCRILDWSHNIFTLNLKIIFIHTGFSVTVILCWCHPDQFVDRTIHCSKMCFSKPLKLTYTRTGQSLSQGLIKVTGLFVLSFTLPPISCSFSKPTDNEFTVCGPILFYMDHIIQCVQPLRKPGKERGAGTKFIAERCCNYR
jgi:hypothetical protein